MMKRIWSAVEGRAPASASLSLHDKWATNPYRFRRILKSPLLSARCKSLRPLGFRRLCDDVCPLGVINDRLSFRHKTQPPRVSGGAHSPCLSLPPHSKTCPVKQGCEPPHDLILSDSVSLTHRMSGLDGIESSSSNVCHSSVCDCTHKSAAQFAVWRRSESRWRWQWVKCLRGKAPN